MCGSFSKAAVKRYALSDRLCSFVLTDSFDEQQQSAQQILNQFRENPESWMLVDKILESASYPQTKCKPPPLCHIAGYTNEAI